MTRLTHAWREMSREQRMAAVAAVALLLTMFLPWYGLQSLNRKTEAIYSHDISAFGDVSFVEAAVFLVAAGVIAMQLARAEGRDFQLPGGDGTIVTVAGGWAALLIFYRVFSRPSGGGYPVGIEWGFFMAFVAAGTLTYAGWRMRHGERPEPPTLRRRSRPSRPSAPAPVVRTPAEEAAHAAAGAFGEDPEAYGGEAAPRRSPRDAAGETAVLPEQARSSQQPPPPRPRRAERARYPPAPGSPEQLSFEDSTEER